MSCEGVPALLSSAPFAPFLPSVFAIQKSQALCLKSRLNRTSHRPRCSPFSHQKKSPRLLILLFFWEGAPLSSEEEGGSRLSWGREASPEPTTYHDNATTLKRRLAGESQPLLRHDRLRITVPMEIGVGGCHYQNCPEGEEHTVKPQCGATSELLPPFGSFRSHKLVADMRIYGYLLPCTSQAVKRLS